MNRIQTPSPSQVESIPSPSFRSTPSSPAESLPGHRSVFAPLHYESGYAYPLLVWLHGPASDESQLMRIMPHISMRNYVAIAPRGTESAASEDGCCWSQEPGKIQVADELVETGIEWARQHYSIASTRVFLAGFGDGGTMALRLALRRPRRFAGAVSICGGMPVGDGPLRKFHEARKRPLLILSGRQSGAYPETQLCRDLRLLYSAGIDVTLRLHPGQDELTSGMLADMDRWLMERVCNDE